MLILFLDMLALWLLLNIFSDESWDDQKLKLFGIVLAISILGGIAAAVAIQYVGAFPAFGAYFFVGTLCLWGLANLQFKKALAAMGIFLVYKIGFVIAISLMFSQ
ncbi:MAG: hypothetical protein JWP89_3857 [Schlesneria sp.]|jgi:hypothetical protein|nr:hypothetical protein [Schlesneria sp.]